MLYHAYELQRSWLNSASAIASISAEFLTNPANPLSYMGVGPMAASALDVFAHATASYSKPAFGIESVEIDGEQLSRYLDAHPEIGYRVLKTLFAIVIERLSSANRRIEYLLGWGLKAHGIEKHL